MEERPRETETAGMDAEVRGEAGALKSAGTFPKERSEGKTAAKGAMVRTTGARSNEELTRARDTLIDCVARFLLREKFLIIIIIMSFKNI